MANQKMIDWIKNQKAEGYSYNQIQDALIQHSYDSNEVNEAIKTNDILQSNNQTNEIDETPDEPNDTQPIDQIDEVDETTNKSPSAQPANEVNETPDEATLSQSTDESDIQSDDQTDEVDETTDKYAYSQSDHPIKKSKNVALYLLIGIFTMAVIGGGIFWVISSYYNSPDANTIVSADTAIEETSDTSQNGADGLIEQIECGVSKSMTSNESINKIDFESDNALVCMGESLWSDCKSAKVLLDTKDKGKIHYEIKTIMDVLLC
ncbi:MAG: hypothetical protein KAI55_00045 [Candidatus Aenigmarchaeota archaeon]|nr:hypothetical protein [Candidatus Aenigmarchaeota archaeon]